MEKNSGTIILEDFVKALNIVNRFIPLRPSIPVLANVLIKTEVGQVKISATNLETSITVQLPAKIVGSWEITIPAKILSEFLSSTSGKEVVLEVDKESLKISTDSAKATISGITASEFPKLPSEIPETKLEFDQKELQEGVTSVAFAASVDEGKPVLTGILLQNKEDKTTIVATDGYRLGKKELKTKYILDDTLIGAKTLVEVLKIAGELGEDKINVSISKENNQVMFSGDSFTLAGRLLAGTYPNFSQIIPTSFKTKVEVKRPDFISAIKSAAVFARDIGNVVKIDVGKKGLIKISANTLQVGDGEASVAAEISGEELTTAFNSRYLLDGLSALKEDLIELHFSGVLSPALFKNKKDQDFIYIVMPVKAQN